MPSAAFRKWAHAARDLAEYSSVVAGAYLRASPDSVKFLGEAQITEWASLGQRLYKGHWKSISLASVYFSASPGLVRSGESAALTWHAPGATSVSITEKGGGPLDLGGQLETGSVDVSPTAKTTWVLTVDGQTREATIDVAPVIELPEDQLPEVYARALADLAPGEPGIAETATGFSVVVNRGRAGGGEYTFEQVAPRIRQQLAAQRAQERFVERLRNEVYVDIRREGR